MVSGFEVAVSHQAPAQGERLLGYFGRGDATGGIRDPNVVQMPVHGGGGGGAE